MLFSTRSFDECGQMVVELAAVTPAVLMVALVIVNSLFFATVTARFDHIAPQAILNECTSPSGAEFDLEQSYKRLDEHLHQQLDEKRVRLEVSSSTENGCEVFTCAVFVRPWPLAEGKTGFLGMQIPFELKHTVSLAVDPYVIGELG